MNWLRKPVGVLLLAGYMLSEGCLTTTYRPQALANGELYWQVRGYRGLELHTRFGRIAREATGFVGLPQHVDCVPKARRHARAAVALSVTGHIFTALSVGAAVAGIVHPAIAFSHPPGDDISLERLFVLYGFGGLSFLLLRDFFLRPHAIGHAADAVNYYNDMRGSLDRTCSEPAPAPPEPPLATPPPAPNPAPEESP